jgi:DNA polymerase III epsilon subunit-like protein
VKWWEGRLCALDCETTGIDLEESRIVTVTIAMVGNGLPSEIVTLMADPGVPIPEAASNVHGVTTEQAQAEGQPAAEVVAAALQLLRAVPTSVPIVGFNLRFDLTILDREARRHGLEPFVPAVVTELGYVSSAAALHEMQVDWAAEQARSLRDYFRQQGKDEAAASVQEAWPVVPAP